MTISTTRTQQFTVGQIIRHAHVMSGLINVEQSVPQKMASFSEEQLDYLVSELVIEGIFPRDVQPYEITLVDGQFGYPMPDYCFDVVDTAMWRSPTSPLPPTAEIPVRPISRQTYQEKATKGAQGMPREYYTDRIQEPPNVILWPIPDASQTGAVIRFQIHVLKAKNTSSSTPDLDRFWSDYLAHALAARLARAAGYSGQAAQLDALAGQKKQLCKGYANERPAQQMVIGHRGGWRGR